MSEKNKGGRPSSYDPKYAEQLLEILETGATKIEAAAQMKISRDTMYRWAKEHKEFGEAFRLGTEWSEAKHASIIRAAALGQIPKFNTAAEQMLVRNMFGWDKFSGEGNYSQTININQMNVLKDKSTEELLTHIHDSMEEVKDVIDISEFDILEDKNAD